MSKGKACLQHFHRLKAAQHCWVEKIAGHNQDRQSENVEKA
jgi:hypothetical protein